MKRSEPKKPKGPRGPRPRAKRLQNNWAPDLSSPEFNIELSEEKQNQLQEGSQSLIPSSLKRSRFENEIEVDTLGPKYTELADSFVLYNPIQSEKFHRDHNRNGLVPVVVHPELYKGKNFEINGDRDKLTQDQMDAITFTFKGHQNGKGSILSHDMGMGKSRIAITFILTLLEQSAGQRGKSAPGAKKVIIVAPKNAIDPGWSDEFDKWTPHSINPGLVFLNALTKKPAQLVRNFDQDADQKILILSYNLFINYIPDMKGFKNPIDLIVCDEAHLLKNNNTKRSKTIRDFQACMKKTVWVGITGTPFNNTLEEYGNLVSFFRPGVLESNYKYVYCRPITNYLLKHGALNEEMQELFATFKGKARSVLHHASNYLKIDKHEMLLCVLLNPNVTENKEYFELQHLLYQECADARMPLMCTFNRLDLFGKICIHPLLAFSKYGNRDEFRPYFQKFKELISMNDEKAENGYSCKISLVVALVLRTLESSQDEKIIIASGSTKMLKRVSDFLSYCNKDPQLRTVQYDGETLNRDKVLRDFKYNDYVRVLFLSSKAGGTALDLTRANHMFLLDPDWNPSNDNQTIGRIYRKKQTRPVFVYRFVCTGTIEETKFLNQLSKKELKYFLEPTDPTYALLKIHCPYLKNNLFTYNPNTKSLIRDALDNQNNAHEFDDKSKIEIQQFLAEFLPPDDNQDRKEDVVMLPAAEGSVIPNSEGAGVHEEDENVNFEVQQFAEELRNADKYQIPQKVSEELPVVKSVWEELVDKNVISFMFHFMKSGSMAKDPFDNILQQIVRKGGRSSSGRIGREDLIPGDVIDNLERIRDEFFEPDTQ